MNNAQYTGFGLVIAGYVYAKDDASNVTYLQKSYEGETPYAGICAKDATLGVVTVAKVKEFAGE